MSYFAYICGTLKCIRCDAESEECVQTKLVQADADSAWREYRQGDLVVIDGLGDYLAVAQWKGGSILNVVIGDWDCGFCGLNYQWAKVSFQVAVTPKGTEPMAATILSMETFAAHDAKSYAGVHYIQDSLAEFARYPALNRAEVISELRLLGAETIIAQVVQGYRLWLEEMLRPGASYGGRG